MRALHKMRSYEDLKKINENFFLTNPMSMCYNNPSRLIRAIENKRTDVIVKEVDRLQGKKLLDIGCEAGHILLSLDKGKRDVMVGLDIAENALEKAKSLANDSKYEFRLGDARRIGFEDSIFDIVLCCHMLEHVNEPELVLEEIRRVLKPSGRSVIGIPNDVFVLRTKTLLKRLGFDLGGLSKGLAPGHVEVYDLRRIKKLLSEHFVIEKICTSPTSSLVLDYVCVCRPR